VISGPNTVFLGEMRSGSVTIPRGEAASVQMRLEMHTGVLTVRGGADDLTRAEFRYTYRGDKPVVEYAVEDGIARLDVTQPEPKSLVLLGGRRINEWDVRLGEGAPIRLDIQIDDSDFTADLRQNWTHDLAIDVRAESGDVTLYLPSQVGVQVTVDRRAREIKTSGLRQAGDVFTNDSYGRTAVSLRITVASAGGGGINLRVG
jgi:hypothetical protein